MIRLGFGCDSAVGGPNADTIARGSGNDVVRGGNGNDTLGGSNGSDLGEGGNGDDDLTGGNCRGDGLRGGPGTDICRDRGFNTRFGGCESDFSLKILHMNDSHSHLNPDSGDLDLAGVDTRVSQGWFPERGGQG